MPDDELTEATHKNFEDLLGPVVSIDGIEHETDDDKINGIVFELYKEAASVVNMAAHLFTEASSDKGDGLEIKRSARDC
jgi:hypothetical protein